MAPKKLRRSTQRIPVEKSDLLQMTQSTSLESLHMGDASDSESEVDESGSEDSTFSLVNCFEQYRLECQELVRSAATMETERHIAALEALVGDLFEQNKCLVESISEIQSESAERVKEMRKRLEKSASRTEEVMLALASHELYLKAFVEEHCCGCCGCDRRLLQFKLCHREHCQGDSQLGDTFPSSCRSYGHEWNSIVSNTSNWLAHKRISDGECLHNLPSHIRFTSLVSKIDARVHQLEVENEDFKQENALIRELNCLLSGRNGPPLTISHCRKELPRPESMYPVDSIEQDICSKEKKDLVGEALSEDLITFLGKSGEMDMFSSYLHDSLELRDGFDSCGGSRSDSLNGRHDNDSGCSTDLIPSQTDINSLMMSDWEEDCDDLLRTTMESIHSRAERREEEDNLEGHHSTLHTRLSQAERLVPKLTSKLLYYLVQRNMLLRQVQQETRARQKSKQELSTLADCVTLGLKDLEVNSQAIKQLQEDSLSPPSMF